MKPLVIEIEHMKLVAGLNARENRWARASRVKRERSTAHWQLMTAKRPPLPVVVRLVRLSAGMLDDDNLSGAFKAIRDGVADAYGIADNDKTKIRFEYDQERCERKRYAIRIEVSPA